MAQAWLCSPLDYWLSLVYKDINFLAAIFKMTEPGLKISILSLYFGDYKVAYLLKGEVKIKSLGPFSNLITISPFIRVLTSQIQRCLLSEMPPILGCMLFFDYESLDHHQYRLFQYYSLALEGS